MLWMVAVRVLLMVIDGDPDGPSCQLPSRPTCCLQMTSACRSKVSTLDVPHTLCYAVDVCGKGDVGGGRYPSSKVSDLDVLLWYPLDGHGTGAVDGDWWRPRWAQLPTAKSPYMLFANDKRVQVKGERAGCVGVLSSCYALDDCGAGAVDGDWWRSQWAQLPTAKLAYMLFADDTHVQVKGERSTLDVPHMSCCALSGGGAGCCSRLQHCCCCCSAPS
jgi:hypothetical protein